MEKQIEEELQKSHVIIKCQNKLTSIKDNINVSFPNHYLPLNQLFSESINIEYINFNCCILLSVL